MKRFKRIQNTYGFSHVELFIVLITVIILSLGGYYVYNKSITTTNAASSNYSVLSNINFDGQIFKEKACSIPLSYGQYKLNVAVSTNRPAGKNTSPSYNPRVLYRIDDLMPNKINGPTLVSTDYDNWISGKTSIISFYLPNEIGSTTFNLGIKGVINKKLIVTWGTTTSGYPYTISSIHPCNPSAPHPANFVVSCTKTVPKTTTNSTYPWLQTVNFMQSKLSNQWIDYGNEIQQPSGYVAASHAVFIPGIGLAIEGYPDKISLENKKIGGVTGGSGDVNAPISGSGGFDVCFSMTGGDWQRVTLAIISWPTSTAKNAWNQGELDIFEGSPKSLGINLHEIGPTPRTNVWQGGWPTTLADGGIHLISARWNLTDGYSFSLDNKLVTNLAPNCLPQNDPSYNPDCVQTPTTPHQLSIQMRDVTEKSSSQETAIIYWTASYGYNQK
ncbi:MAG TPA: hypothetical protein VMR76_00780 [Candidatus Saccharimonadia bacterium]|nr:hypothetical protein [Candidatus Saccharimonadia bacterium]